jgi:hypothetical protein
VKLEVSPKRKMWNEEAATSMSTSPRSPPSCENLYVESQTQSKNLTHRRGRQGCKGGASQMIERVRARFSLKFNEYYHLTLRVSMATELELSEA